MGSLSVSSCRYCKFVSCVHPVAVLNATVLFSVCIPVTVEWCVMDTCCMGVFGMFAVMYGRRLLSSVFAIT